MVQFSLILDLGRCIFNYFHFGVQQQAETKVASFRSLCGWVFRSSGACSFFELATHGLRRGL